MRETVEDVVGATAKFIFKVIIWDFALFQVGRAVMLAVTLGRYPTRKDCAQSHGRIQWVQGRSASDPKQTSIDDRTE